MISRKLFSSILGMSLALLWSGAVLAQLGTAGLSGLVSDTNGAAIPNSRVIVKNKATAGLEEPEAVCARVDRA